MVQDPANLRLHPDANKKAIVGSVRRFKPWRSISIDEGNVIYAGNETANACAAEGYKEVVVVDLQPGQLLAARRSDLTETEKTAYGIADNQTALTASWADELPDAINSLQLDGFDVASLGFSDAQLKKYLGQEDDPNAGKEQDIPAKWLVVVTCRNEAHQLELLEKFQGEGIECSAIVS